MYQNLAIKTLVTNFYQSPRTSAFMGLSNETPMVPWDRIGWEIYHFGLSEGWQIRYTGFPGVGRIFHLSN